MPPGSSSTVLSAPGGPDSTISHGVSTPRTLRRPSVPVMTHLTHTFWTWAATSVDDPVARGCCLTATWVRRHRAVRPMRLRTSRDASSALLVAQADPGKPSPAPTSTWRKRARSPRPGSARQLQPRPSERPLGNGGPAPCGVEGRGVRSGVTMYPEKAKTPAVDIPRALKTFEKCNCNRFQRYTLDAAAQAETAMGAPSADGGEDDQLLRRPGHG